VLDFYEDKIEKLGNWPFLPENNKNNYNLIIETPGYFKYRDNFDLSEIDHKNTEFKEYNSRSPDFFSDHELIQAPEIERRICAKFPQVPVFDFEIRKIRHCSRKAINGSREFDITKENITKMMDHDLFQFEKYCTACMDIIPPRPKKRRLAILEKIAFEEVV